MNLVDSYADGLDREWARLAAAGTWWTGAERVAMARVARAARATDSGRADLASAPLPEAAVEAAERLSADPHVDLPWVEDLERRGLDRRAYVEVLGIVARLNAVDTFLFGIGSSPRRLPDPRPGEPTRATVPDAVMNGGFVPTVGPASAPNALSAVAAETEALMDLHGVLYLSMAEMGDLEIVKDLNRCQIELVAARTSLLNECFF